MKNFRKDIFLRWGIAPKFILAILLFSTLVTIILTLIQVYTGYKDGLDSIDRSIIQVEGSYLDSIINDLWLSDTELLQTHLSGMMKLRDMQYIDVVSRHETLAKVGVFTEKHVVKKEFPLTYTYANKTISLGKLRIHYTLDNLYERLKKSAISIILFQSIVIFLVSGFFFFIFYLLVARHLYALVAYSKSLRVKTLDTPFSLKRYKNNWGEDEFDILVSAINEMRMDLSESYSRLKIENSERLQAEKSLNESEEEFRLLYQQAPVMLHNVDMEGRLTEVNEQWLKTLGYEREDVLGRRSIEFLTPESQQHAINLFPELYEKGVLRDTEYQFVTKQGEVRDVLLTAYMVKNINEESLSTRAAIIDITERNRIREEKDKLVQQLHQSQKMEAIGTLAGGIAHDFNNILSAIIGFTELAKMRTADDEVTQKKLENVLKSGDRAKELVQHLLTFSRKAEVERKVLKITPLLKETIKFIKATAPSNVNIACQVNNPESCLFADSTQMHQVFMNIFTNAVHAMKDSGGDLDIKIDNISLYEGDAFQFKQLAPGKYVNITVSDSGYGIPKDKIERIFDPFFTTKGKGEGTGLGLSVTYGIIHEMGGHISVYSEENIGTTFKIFLPEVSESTDSLHKSNSTELKRGSGTILLVDDEPDIIEWTSDLLTQLGYGVIADSDPHNALELFTEDPERFDLVITDLTMPKMVGTKLAEHIHAVRPNLPIILCTGFREGVADEVLERNGVLTLLMKPVIPSELSLVVETCLTKEGNEG